MDRKLLLGIDFNNILFSSFYGESLINSKGQNVNAIKGFFFRIKNLIETFNPDYLIMANDIGREKTFRRKLYKNYKSQRKPRNDDLIFQLQQTLKLTSLLGYPIINNELYEADDILGMVSKYTTEQDMDMIIISSDKDLYQLVNENVFIFSPRNKELIDLDWLYNKYKLTPQRWIDFKILTGDSSDNIPGIGGIGEVTALKLLNQYKDIDDIYQNLNKIKPVLKDKFIQKESFIPIIRELVTIIIDYNKINFHPNMIERSEVFPNEIFQTIQELEIPSLHNIMKYNLIN